MKVRKFLAGIMASAVAVSAMAAVASANEAFLMYASGDWSCSAMGTDAYPDGNIDVKGDGTYTVTTGGFTWEDEDTGEMVPASCAGAIVFCVDITDLATDLGCGTAGNKDTDTPEKKMELAKSKGINITDVKVTSKNADGTTTDYPVDSSKIVFGDIEGNGKIRIEIYNEYGNTKNDPPFDHDAVAFDDTISVTFTITGISAPDAAQTVTDAKDAAPAPTTGDTAAAVDSSKGSPDTGVADVAAIAGIAVVAAGAFIVSKKRK